MINETTIYLLIAMIFTLFIGTTLAVAKMQGELEHLKGKRKKRDKGDWL